MNTQFANNFKILGTSDVNTVCAENVEYFASYLTFPCIIKFQNSKFYLFVLYSVLLFIIIVAEHERFYF